MQVQCKKPGSTTHCGWPNYEATYLAKRLNLEHKAAERNRYSVDTERERIKQLTYDNKITDNYKEDADEDGA